jgi:hypothetical protein
VVLAGALTACGSGSKSGFDPDNGASGGPGGGGPAGDGGAFADDVVSQPPQTVAEVYGQSNNILYKLDPLTKAVTVIGPFEGCTDVIDIALDGTSKLYGATAGGLWSIDKTNAKCTKIHSGNYPNSLSFVPKGTVDPKYEALVGYNGSTYVRIDTASGIVSPIGSLGSGLVSSGDIVSVNNGPTYLTVQGSGCNDCIVEVDPRTGSMIKNWGSIKHSNVYGLAFWAGSVYGFDDSGDLFEVKFANNAITTTPIPVPNPPSRLSFWGAGSTTSAPVTPTN